MYNPYQGQQYGRPGSFGPFGGHPGGPPPGMPAPAWMGASGAPGVGLPPGVQSASATPTGRPGGLPPGFDPNNLPKIDFSAPVIRLGAAAPSKLNAGMITTGLSGRRDSSTEGLASVNRAGVGAGGVEQQRSTLRESMQSLVPSTKDEIARTVFVGGITDGVGDDGVERILQSAGKLRKWSRAIDADGRTCSFGFAEYEAAEHLATAVEVLKDIEIPKKRQDVKPIKTEHKSEVKQEDGSENGVDEEVEMSTLLVVVDENSLNYLEHYQASRGEEDPSRAQARLDAARASLSLVLASLAKPSATSDLSAAHANGDQSIPSSDPPAEIVNITLAADDELSDIPLEMRETVAQEIASFRKRSVRRDMERLRREEELEAAERVRISNIGGRPSRMTSPPAFANSNSIPLGPRAAQPPTGPKASFAQIPRDYTSGVNFLPSSAAAAADEDDSASDSELEKRRQLKKTTEQEKAYLDQERRWLNRERSRTAAVEREAQRDISDVALQQRAADAAGKRLADYDDDVEAGRRAEEYYQDRSLWVRNRAAYRHREMEWDERDRAEETRERQRREQGQEEAEILADSFLDRHAVALGPQAVFSSGDRGEATASAAAAKKFTLALGAAAQRSTAGRRTVAEVEGLLEDEEDEGQERKRTLIPIQETAMGDVKAMTQDLTAEQRDEAIRQLAAEIPTEKEGLWKWPVKWDLVTEEVIDGRLRPFVEKKIVEYLGVQEQMLVELVEAHVRKRGGAEELVGELEGAMEDEAEQLVKKLWRMIIFFSESERRGLSA